MKDSSTHSNWVEDTGRRFMMIYKFLFPENNPDRFLMPTFNKVYSETIIGGEEELDMFLLED